jgi:hypothetical protein
MAKSDGGGGSEGKGRRKEGIRREDTKGEEGSLCSLST